MKSIAFGVVTSLVIALLIGPSIIKALRKMKFGQKILEDGPTWHMNKQNTPTMGGIIFIAAIIVPIIVLLPAMVSIGDYRPVLMLALSLVFAAIGFVDDYTKIKKKQNKGLTAKQKLLLQLAASALFITVMRTMGYLEPEIYLPFVNITLELPWWLYLAFSVFVIVGCDNAVNLTDGIDGLCASVTAVVAVFFCGVFAILGSSARVFSAALLGGLIGFLYFNKYPAKVFMGDTGSLFLGGAVCAMAYACNMPVILVPVGIIYIAETLSDIIQVLYFKATHGKRFFKMAPIHHHFEMCGWSEKKIVAVFTAVTAVMCVISYWGIAAAL
ncbi:MAG: phospho-N-acetylmuramoyl-pentapeptide-transferase [Clostridia bacterium]|nr:phospho-N-acetylmuramoyl-pentapeptide-transferase [Clostridia bacterium]MBQ2327283.1 phospho-N-acetylmuramoyl-pentapeptide-transferase [Clostridia bacterium]MBQ5812679.1 phospho-N-acetylmuramoyl-pentapeptide-transferase [Clostridia bacterium]